MRSVLRHRFMPGDVRDYAYEDRPVPIGHGQTISQPYIVALMTEEMRLKGDEKVLEIGTGSGYQAAVLATIVPEVYSIEIIDALAERAQATLDAVGYDNVHVLNADGYDGWAEHAPYDAIIITCAVDHVPPSLVAQLAEGGMIVLPLGDPRLYQSLTVVEKKDGKVTSRHVLDVRFVPMTGRARD
jgi:protein-L-isoaspartate(D-aspartate) O-methyltransferase